MSRISTDRNRGESTDDHFTRIALLRTQQVVNIWPVSPPGPSFTLSDSDTPEPKKPSKKQRKSKKRSYSSSSQSDKGFNIPLKPVSDDEDIGPEPEVITTIEIDDRDYGAMLKGEGAAIAAYVQAGKRIPRRGEVGIDPEVFEKEGYVMSGNRNKHMEGVRVKKEALVLNAEEKRAIFLLAQQDKQRREAEVMSTFKEIVSDRMRQIGGQE